MSGGSIERIKYGTAPLGELQPALARIDRRTFSLDVAPAPEFFYQAAHVTEVESKLARNLGRRGIPAIRQFVQDASFGQRKFAPQQPLVEQAQLTRVPAIEAPNDIYGLTGRARIRGRSHRSHGIMLKH